MSGAAPAPSARQELDHLLQDLGLSGHVARARTLLRLEQLCGPLAEQDATGAAEQAIAAWVAQAARLDLGGGLGAWCRAVAVLELSDALRRWPEHFLAPVETLPAAVRRSLAEALPLAQPQPLVSVMAEQRLEVALPELMPPLLRPLRIRRS